MFLLTLVCLSFATCASSVKIPATPGPATNCCLTRLCPEKNGPVLGEMTRDKFGVPELFDKLCTGPNLVKERLSGCTFRYNRNSEVNRNTNNAESILANCSAKFLRLSAETAIINSGMGVEKLRDKKIRFGNAAKMSARISGLQFLDVPQGDEMRIYKLKLEEEHLLFGVFSTLMGYLQSGEFPTELLKDAWRKRLPFHQVAFQLLKLEFGVLGWVIFWTIITFFIIFITISYFCCSKRGIRRLSEDSSEISVDFRDKCVEATLIFLLVFLLLLQLCPIALIIIGNEQVSRQVSNSLDTTNLIFDDLETFTRNTHMQMSFAATSSTDIAFDALRKDLDDVEQLLGRPFQQELAAETGIDPALDGLDELVSDCDKVTALVNELLDECVMAERAGNLLQEKLTQVSNRLSIVRIECRPKDRPLCFTLPHAGLQVAFSCTNLTKIKQLAADKNFAVDVENARNTFGELPARVSKQTVPYVAALKSVLSRKRNEVYKSAHSLDELARDLSNSLKITQIGVVQVVEDVNRWDLWRWLAVLGICALVSLVWGLLLCGAPCGCEATSRTTPVLLSGVVFTSLISVVVWSLGMSSFLLATHGQSLLCQPLYDAPRYRVLGDILDSSGMFEAFLRANDSLKIRDVLKNCERDAPAYATFHVHNVFDPRLVTNYKSWFEFRTAIDQLEMGRGKLEILSPTLHSGIRALALAASLNLTQYRAKISGPLTKKELNSFADQLNTVARQLNDPTTSRRIDDLALTLRKIIHNELASLADLRDRILYKITALDFFVRPLSRKANLSLARLEDVQLFIDAHGEEVAQRVVNQFRDRLRIYLEELRNYTITKITKEIGTCKPLWQIFHAARFSFCKLVVDPVNGISLACLVLILLFLGTVPTALNLVEHYRSINEEILSSITHRRARDGAIIDEEGTWPTPSSLETPPDAETRNEQSTWVTPTSRQSSELLIPPPPSIPASTSRPHRLSTIASRITAARVTQIPSVSRARSPKRGRHDSLRLIEPICWKSGSLSPKSWL